MKWYQRLNIFARLKLLEEENIELKKQIDLEFKLKTNQLVSLAKHNESLIKSFISTCDIGYDIGMGEYHKNWCVIARQGRSNHQDFVKFIDLSNMSLDGIKHFEKILEHESGNAHRRAKIDAPMGIKDYFMFK